jgi:hypothetical protein
MAVLFMALSSPAQLAVVETVQIDFGSVLDSSGSIILGLNDMIIIDPSNIHVGGVPYSGNYLITGTPNTPVQINITAQNANGLTLADFNTNWGAPPLIGTSLDAGGELELIVGAKLTVNSGEATPGLDQPMAFTIIVNYN